MNFATSACIAIIVIIIIILIICMICYGVNNVNNNDNFNNNISCQSSVAFANCIDQAYSVFTSCEAKCETPNYAISGNFNKKCRYQCIVDNKYNNLQCSIEFCPQ